MLKIKTNEKLLFGIYIIIFLIFLIIRNILLVDISPYIIVVLTAIYTIISKRNPLELLMFLIPFASAVPTNYIIMILLIIYLLKYNTEIRMDSSYIFLFVILAIETINCVNIYSTLTELVNFAIILILTTMHFSSGKVEISKDRSIKKYILGTVIATAMFIVITFQYITIDHFLTYESRLNDLSAYLPFSQYALNFNANDLALYILIAISLLFCLNYYRKVNKKIFLILLIFLIVSGFLTMSRAFLLCLGAIIIYIVLFSKNRVSIILKLIIFTCFFAFMINLLMPNFSRELESNFSERFSVQDKSGGRNDLLKEYNSVIMSNPKKFLIGSGIQNYNKKNKIDLACHNATQEIIIAWGVIGFIAMMLLIIKYILSTIKQSQKLCALEFLPLVILVLMTQTIQFFSSGMKIFLLIVTLLTIGISGNIERKEQKDEQRRTTETH